MIETNSKDLFVQTGLSSYRMMCIIHHSSRHNVESFMDSNYNVQGYIVERFKGHNMELNDYYLWEEDGKLFLVTKRLSLEHLSNFAKSMINEFAFVTCHVIEKSSLQHKFLDLETIGFKAKEDQA